MVRTVDEAKRALEKNRFGILLVAAREASIFLDFLRWIRAQHPRVSIVCIPEYGSAFRAAQSGADLFMDLQGFPQDHHGDRRIRHILDEVLETSSYRK